MGGGMVTETDDMGKIRGGKRRRGKKTTLDSACNCRRSKRESCCNGFLFIRFQRRSKFFCYGNGYNSDIEAVPSFPVITEVCSIPAAPRKTEDLFRAAVRRVFYRKIKLMKAQKNRIAQTNFNKLNN
ncbi:hypothetical protein PoB_004346000 [Plakobranchus ocellatus]|uniref:Uncharacterized protein n=1 Tax=Plakobranchus ocellatus TaxID=259542 RepID=A0AAV4BBP2_9GAST|nr:hypothetical protein PoB_004346000 [Plakobranchus ocellatus]